MYEIGEMLCMLGETTDESCNENEDPNADEESEVEESELMKMKMKKNIKYNVI